MPEITFEPKNYVELLIWALPFLATPLLTVSMLAVYKHEKAAKVFFIAGLSLTAFSVIFSLLLIFIKDESLKEASSRALMGMWIGFSAWHSFKCIHALDYIKAVLKTEK